MPSEDVSADTDITHTQYNALRAEVVVLQAAVAAIQAAASFHADYVLFEDEVRFDSDTEFKAYRVGTKPIYQFEDDFLFELDKDLDRINAKIGGTVTAYADSSGWHNV